MADSKYPPSIVEPEDVSQTTFRTADVDEDVDLSRILCNAFLPLGNHNWFQDVSEPLDPVPLKDWDEQSRQMTHLQSCRVQLYLSLIKMTRLLGGSILIASVPTSSDNADRSGKDVRAILLRLPPFKRMSIFDLPKLWQLGFLSLILPWNYGITGFYRIQLVFEANVKSMFARSLSDLPSRGFREEDCGFVQMLASNPSYAGKGYASTLLKYQMERHFEQHPSQPVILDTTTMQGIKAYEKLDFRLLAQTAVQTNTDARGIRLKTDQDEKVREDGRKTCIQRVMVKMP